MSNPIHINFFGSCGVGKSTCSSDTFQRLKKQKLQVAYIPELVKLISYKQTFNEYKDQLKIMADQNNYLQFVIDSKPEIIVNEYPAIQAIPYLELCNFYNKEEVEHLKAFFMSLFNRQDNINIYLTRFDDKVAGDGRWQDEAQVRELDKGFETFMNDYVKDFIECNYNNVQEEVFKALRKRGILQE